MTATLRDPDTLRSLRPLEIRRYLEATGWQRSRVGAPHSPCWTLRKGKSDYEVLVPPSPELRDYPLRITELLHTLEVAESRSLPEIWQDLTLSGYDVVRVRVQPKDCEPGSIKLDQGIVLVQSTREMLLAAACAAVEPRRAYPTRKARQAAEFIQRVRLGAPERGSFVVTALSPVPPSLEPGADGQERLDVAEPFERDVMLKLVGSLGALRRAAEGGSTTDFDAVVREGVSANLCAAIADMDAAPAGTEGVEVALSWARTRPVAAGLPRRVLISSGAMPVIREAARVFRETTPVEEFELTGTVIRLDRPDTAREGTVTILGFVEGSPRRVTLQLEPAEYAVAIRAHEERLPVQCAGVLRRTATSFRLEGVRGFDVANVT